MGKLWNFIKSIFGLGRAIFNWVVDIVSIGIDKIIGKIGGWIGAIIDRVAKKLDVLIQTANDIAGYAFSMLPDLGDQIRKLSETIILIGMGTMSENFENIQNAMIKIVRTMLNAFDGFNEGLNDIVQYIHKLFKDDVIGIIHSLESWGWETINRLALMGTPWWTSLMGMSSTTMDALTTLTPTIWERIRSLGSDVWTWLKDHAREVIEAIKVTAGDAWRWIQAVGIDLKAKALWVWDEIKTWYEDHLKWFVDKMKPWLEKVNATLTLTNNIVRLKAAIQTGKIEQVFRSVLELMTTTLSDVAKVFDVTILQSIADFSLVVTQRIHDTVEPVADLLNTVNLTMNRVSRWLPDALLTRFTNITTWLDGITQPFVGAITMLERETRARLSYLRGAFLYGRFQSLRPSMIKTGDFKDQLMLWQFILGRIIAGI